MDFAALHIGRREPPFRHPHCQSTNHVGDSYCGEEIWVCGRCKKSLCENDGCADGLADWCDSCWGARQTERRRLIRSRVRLSHFTTRHARRISHGTQA